MQRSTSLSPAALLAGLTVVTQSFAQDAPVPAAEGAVELQAQAVQGPAVPADEVKSYLGIGSSAVPGFLGKHLGLPAGTGVMVRSLDPDGPAAKAGFTVDDVITQIDGKAVASHRQMAAQFLTKTPGEDVAIDFIHEGKPGNRTVKLGERPADPPAAAAAGPNIKVLEGQLNLGGGIPPEVDQQMRKAMEGALKQGFGNRMGIQIIPGGQGGIQLLPGGNGQQNGARFEEASSIRMMEPDGGALELKNRDGGSEVRVTDKDGKEVWSGPWDTDQDKAAAPASLRKRLEKLNIMQRMNLPGPAPAEEVDQAADEPAQPKAEPKP